MYPLHVNLIISFLKYIGLGASLLRDTREGEINLSSCGFDMGQNPNYEVSMYVLSSTNGIRIDAGQSLHVDMSQVYESSTIQR